MPFLLVLVIASAAAAETPGRLPRSESLLVRRVIDGHTIDVATKGRVRLLGIDAPRSGTASGSDVRLGQQARDRLAGLVLNHWVRLEYEVEQGGGSSRRGAYLWREDGVFVNAVLVRDGLARVNARRPLVRLAELRAAEHEAQASRRGLWGLASAPAGSMAGRQQRRAR
jgi:micrococcal nuclease